MSEGFKSEIRHSTIEDLFQKVQSRNYRFYLAKVVLKRLRGFSDEPVSFDFPVTALVGPNGGGKTTILGAAGCAYKSVSPRRFFAKSGIYDDSMQDWSIEYDLVDKAVNPKDVVRRTASFKSHRWKRDSLDRAVLVFGVNRTVPTNEKKEFLKCASSRFKVPSHRVTEFSDIVKTCVSRILGKDVSEFRSLRVDEAGKVSLFTGRTKSGDGYSEFHFGAGESSIIRMVSEIELANEQTLVLIEEIENGLHPVAVVRLVEYLIFAAERRRIQVIFSTHSNDALRPLPSKAIWVATQDRIFQGKLDIQSLRAVTGQVEARLIIYVEDVFAKMYVEAILRNMDGVAIDHIGVYAMEGDGIAVAINKYHNKDPSSRVPSICYIDGDSKQEENPDEGVYRLPGGRPESFIFESVMENFSDVGGKLTVALLQPFERSEKVKSACEQVAITNSDSHLLFTQIGERLGLIPGSTVAAAFVNTWAHVNGEVISEIQRRIGNVLPAETG